MICSLCDARCCKNKLITVTIFDVIRIIKNTGKKMEEFAELSRPRILNLDTRFILECSDGDYLLALKSHPCVFLDRNRCNIYEFSPLACRIYPFNINGSIGVFSSCPSHAKVLFKIRGVDKRLLKKQIEEEKAYVEIINEWNKIKGNKEECVDFILKRGNEEFRRFI